MARDITGHLRRLINAASVSTDRRIHIPFNMSGGDGRLYISSDLAEIASGTILTFDQGLVLDDTRGLTTGTLRVRAGAENVIVENPAFDKSSLSANDTPVPGDHGYDITVGLGARNIILRNVRHVKSMKGIQTLGDRVTIDHVDGVPLYRGIEADGCNGKLSIRDVDLSNGWASVSSVAGLWQADSDNGCNGFRIMRVGWYDIKDCVIDGNYALGASFKRTEQSGFVGGPQGNWSGGKICGATQGIDVIQIRPNTTAGETDSGEGRAGVSFNGIYISSGLLRDNSNYDTVSHRSLRVQSIANQVTPDLATCVYLTDCRWERGGDNKPPSNPHPPIIISGRAFIKDNVYLLEDRAEDVDTNYFLRLDAGELNMEGGSVRGHTGERAIQIQFYTRIRISGVNGLGGTSGPIASGRIVDSSGLGAPASRFFVDADMLFPEFTP